MQESYEYIETQLIQSLNLALNIDNETSYNHAFDIQANQDGFWFIPRLPAGFVVDSALYDKIYRISGAILYPNWTLLKQNGAYFVPTHSQDFHTQRALFFPWVEGNAKRLVIDDIDEFTEKWVNNKLPIMENLDINIDKINHIGIAGQSGSGKSTFLIFLLYLLKERGSITICDPKLDSPSRFARKFDIPVIAPVEVQNQNDFVSSVTAMLSQHLDLIHDRQRELYKDPNAKFEHNYIVIDELLALTENVAKNVAGAFQSVISQIALLGRATNVHLILVSQRFDAHALSTATREQLNVLIQIGNINSRTTSFLMPDLDPNGIVVPQGIGSGLIQIIDSEHPYQVLPLLTPSFKTKEVL
ncbi:cell division protein FtsK [Fructobacillus sp. M1-13]|uniref:Cell division protein FtsK n=1 Tax=Fructobacillus papyriferae TaxID=2713171 RepID=A0ABS5QNW9_9LACO|nr:ATP-binding cassette domain-containing protein [Fructobacillus papyriferae]MBS9334833.1 cell division protein FtsK [Fructobacillus papyriferae]MCD2158823.1 cell division protein FtsK [Fructobacillus papyriferae]